MKTSAVDFRSKLKKAKGLGAAGHGVGHWWYQRLTAVAMLPLSIWFLAELLRVLVSPDFITVAAWFASPVNALLLSALLIAVFFHAKLGLQVVIEDYVHGPFGKYTLLLANNFFCWAAAIFCIVAVLKLHFIDMSIGAS